MNDFSVIFLLGMPRSGTSWLSQIFDSSPDVRFKLSPLFSYAFKNATNVKSTKEEWQRLFQNVYGRKDEFMDQEYRRRDGDYPTFAVKKDHPRFLVIKDTRYHNLTQRILELFPDIRIVYIVRHPCGAIHSWLTASKEFPSDADPKKEWRTGACRKTGPEEFWGFQDWKIVTSLYQELAKQYPANVAIVQYERIVDDPLQESARLFRFAGIPMHQQTVDFLLQSQTKHQQNDYAVFKDKSVKDRWKRELDPDIQHAILEDVRGTLFEQYCG